MFAIRKGNWKLIEGRGSGGFTPPRSFEETGRQLYDLAEDPQETRNLHARRSEIVAELQDLLRATLKWHGRARQPKLRPPRACRWTPHAGP